ncbi:MAG: hypothetical protein WB495_01260, partial [Xanthobacteraceae bacterium]
KTLSRIVQKIKPRNGDGEILAASGAEMTSQFCLLQNSSAQPTRNMPQNRDDYRHYASMNNNHNINYLEAG